MRRTAEDVIIIGQALIRQKQRLPHGLFLPWIECEFAMSERTAQNLMRVATRFESKSATVADLNMRALTELASADIDVQAEVERRIAAGDIGLAHGRFRWFVAGVEPVVERASDDAGIGDLGVADNASLVYVLARNADVGGGWSGWRMFSTGTFAPA